MIKEDKVKKGGNNASSWHLKGDTRQTLQLPITPGSDLTRKVKDKIKDMVGPDKGKTMTVEMGGLPITSGLMKNDPFKSAGCRFGDPNCIVQTDDDCMRQNIVYQITCQEPDCSDKDDRKNLYIGQSGRSSHARAREHHRGLINKDPRCPLTKHSDEYHPLMTDIPSFIMKTVKGCRGNIDRLLTESQKIDTHDDRNLMNSKMEYGTNKMVRFRPTVDRV